jgi:predicted ATPase/class 3 adenylate cyclase/DNA-binding CsgD family transcriptional regulator
VARLPEGTVTFLLTDLQGSTQAWEKQPGAMRSAMARHDAILAGTVRDHAGVLVEAGREGDSVLAVFKTAGAAAAGALDIQKSFAGESWPEGLELKLRVALHTGEAQLRQGHYFGPALNRCARLLAICHPGQILLTKATESMLADELPPGAELQDLGLHRLKDLARPEQVFQLKELASSIEFPPIRSPLHEQTNLPRYLDTFIGRSAELTALKSSLAKSRMVTLTGAGGSGKTRLAAELGWACLDDWPGGVWWVDLASVDDPSQVPGAAVAALHLSGRGRAQEVVTAWLAARRAVLVLDDCEHLVAACAEFCQAALERCPELSIIATSQEGLGVLGELRWPVSSMPASDAVRLFEARAQLVVPTYRITRTNRDAADQICARLDGMPLAIELAAAHIEMLTEQELLTQLSDRFRLLKGGSRTAPARQQTMLATIDWSYRLLGEDEARLFRRLSVFRGGFTLESAQAVCGDGIASSVLDVLVGLVRKSMVVAERAGGPRSRYRLLESQLAYAEERLRETGELEILRRQHYEYFKDAVAARTFWRTGRRWAVMSLEGADWMAQESGNVWAGLEWARTNAEDLGLSLASDFVPSDVTRRRKVLRDLLAHSPAQGEARIKALVGAAVSAAVQGDFGEALEMGETAVSLAREIRNATLLAVALNRLGMVHRVHGELDAAAELYTEATAIHESSTNPPPVHLFKLSVANLALDTGDYPGALVILDELVSTARAEGNDMLIAACLAGFAYARLGMNDHQAASARWKEALTSFRRLDDVLGIVNSLKGLSCVAAASGKDDPALRLAAAASRLSREWSMHSEPRVERYAEAAERLSRSRLGTVKSEEAWRQGWAFSLDQAIDYALGGGEPEKAVDAGPLSVREREVAKLVAAGLTNGQIAKHLFISERTAEGHVEHIRNKLGVRSRTEIATWAVERGLAKTNPRID